MTARLKAMQWVAHQAVNECQTTGDTGLYDVRVAVNLIAQRPPVLRSHPLRPYEANLIARWVEHRLRVLSEGMFYA